LLTESARLGHEAAIALHRQLSSPDEKPSLQEVGDARRKGKVVINTFRESLVRHFITPMEREDLEVVAQGLYAIPKVVEKCAERHELSWDRLREVDLSLGARMLVQATAVVVDMTAALGNRAPLAEIKALEARLSQIEDNAGHILLDSARQLYRLDQPPLRTIIATEILDILQSGLAHCGSLGGTMARVLMKNS
jgi:uncharacterized protein